MMITQQEVQCMTDDKLINELVESCVCYGECGDDPELVDDANAEIDVLVSEVRQRLKANEKT